jgi:hypothetical protein
LLAPLATQEPTTKDPSKAVRSVLGPNWVTERDSVSGTNNEKVRLHSFLCRLRARGGFPYQKFVVSHDGKILAQSSHRELLDRARSKSLQVAAKGKRDGITVRPNVDATGLTNTFRAVQAGYEKRVRGPVAALEAAVALVDMLTVKGQFLSAKVDRRGDDGFTVSVLWKQGSSFWGFKEQASWTVAFDRAGSLVRVDKKQQSYERQLRR